MEAVLLEARELRKSFPGVDAVRGVSLSIRAGTCFGLLGPNGAGKTTTVEMLEGILPPDAGDILFRGEPLSNVFVSRRASCFSLLRYRISSRCAKPCGCLAVSITARSRKLN